MPVKILLADKSITIQKVVEMLFSGRDYEVLCVSDGETALSEAARVSPDVVLVDVDLPRVDGYALASRMKQTPQLASLPVILMMSRDDVYDSVKGKQAGILDNIAKPFESQELIGKVKKALAAAPPRLAEPAPRPAAPEPPASKPFAEPRVPKAAAPEAPPSFSKPKKPSTPSDIFEIIQEAPSDAEIRKAAAAAPAPPISEDAVYEVEAEVEEVAASLAREVEKALPTGPRAVEEIRAGLGLSDTEEDMKGEIVPFESLAAAMEMEPPVETPTLPKKPATPAPAAVAAPALPEAELRIMAEKTMARMAQEAIAKIPVPSLSASDLWGMAEEKVAKMAREVFSEMPQPAAPQVSDGALRSMMEEVAAKTVKASLEGVSAARPAAIPSEELRGIAEETISKMAVEIFKDMTPPIPKISEDTVRRGIQEAVGAITRQIAREVIEQVAWEVIPQLAENLIKEEIERLKALQ